MMMCREVCGDVPKQDCMIVIMLIVLYIVKYMVSVDVYDDDVQGGVW